MPPVNSRTIMMSRPATSSRFNVEASANASNTNAGRRLANRSISLRSFSRPRSGCNSNGKVSHFGPPTEPNSTASLACAWASASSVSGVTAPASAPREHQHRAALKAGETAVVEKLDDAHDLAHDLRADAVTGQDENFAVRAGCLSHF